MLARRIIPALDIQEGRVVKCVRFLNPRDAGDPVDLARLYDQEGADEIIFLDITASHERRDIMLDVARRVAEQVFIPFTVGGGIRSVEHIREILKTGADKIFITTAAVQIPQLITEGAERFGSQCIVVGIDAKRRTPQRVNESMSQRVNESMTPVLPSVEDKSAYSAWLKEDWAAGWEVYVHGGRTPTGLDAIEFAVKSAKLGAGEILLTSMDGDGTQAGYDIALTRRVAEAVNVPVIASGGAGTIDHVFDALTAGKAEAALIASIIHYGTYTIGEIKDALRRRGVVVR
jgi:cyclase